MYYLGKNLKYIPEFFGGLIIDLETFRKLEINKSESIFIYGIISQLDINDIKIIHQILNIPITFSINKFLSQNIIKCDNNIYNYNNNKEYIINHLKSIFNEIRLHAPLELTIYPSMNCNLDCRFCFVNNKNEKKFLSLEKLSEIIDFAKNKNILTISVLGGEPLLYPHISELIDMLGKSNILSTITTNGVYINRKIVQQISKYKNIKIIFSIQSLDQLNIQLMNISPDIIIQKIKLAKEYNLSIRLNTVYTLQNLKQLENIIDFVYLNDIDRYSISYYVNNNPKNDINISISLKDFRKLEEYVNSYVKNYYKKNKVFLEGCLKYSAYNNLTNNKINSTIFQNIQYGCNAGRSKIEILSNGNVLPCICYEGLNLNFGNIYQDNLFNIWHKNSLFFELDNYINHNSKCTACNFYSLCNGGCTANNFKENGRLNSLFEDKLCAI